MKGRAAGEAADSFDVAMDDPCKQQGVEQNGKGRPEGFQH